MSGFAPLALDSLFVLNSTFSKSEETEAHKIVYYFPPSADYNKQHSDVGLSEALVHFANTFSQSPIELIRTEKCRWIFTNMETDYWIVMIVTHPCTTKSNGDVEYHAEDVEDDHLYTMLKRFVSGYKLLYGSLGKEYERLGKDPVKLQQHANVTMTHCIKTLNITELGVSAVLEGVEMLPTDKNVFMKTQSLFDALIHEHDDLKNAIVFYKSQLLWSGVDYDQLLLFSRYWNQIYQHQLQCNTNTSKVLLLPFLPEKNTIRSVFIGPDLEEHHIFFAILQDLVVMFITKPTLTTASKNLLLEEIQPSMAQLAEALTYKLPSKPDEFKYIYFNSTNLAIKNTMTKVNLSKETMSALNQLHKDLTRSKEGISEVLLRTCQDLWLIGRRSGDRILLVMVDQQNMDLLDVDNAVKQICLKEFSDIFLG